MTTRQFNITIGGQDVDQLFGDNNGGIILVTRDEDEVRLDELVIDRIAELAARRTL